MVFNSKLYLQASINKSVSHELPDWLQTWWLASVMGMACSGDRRPDGFYYGHQIKDLRTVMRNTFFALCLYEIFPQTFIFVSVCLLYLFFQYDTKTCSFKHVFLLCHSQCHKQIHRVSQTSGNTELRTVDQGIRGACSMIFVQKGHWSVQRSAHRQKAVPQWPPLRSLSPPDRRAVVLREHCTSKLWLRSEHPDHYAELKNTTCAQFTRIYSCNVAMYFLGCHVIYIVTSTRTPWNHFLH